MCYRICLYCEVNVLIITAHTQVRSIGSYCTPVCTDSSGGVKSEGGGVTPVTPIT